MVISKKTWKEAFEKIISGDKTFDARLGDFNCRVGDKLVLEEYDSKRREYTGRKVERKITYILDTKKQNYWSQKDIEKHGLKIIGFK